MRGDSLAALGLAALAAILAVAALLSFGGPAAGRAEKRDETRIDDLLELAAALECTAEATNGTLPETLRIAAVCTEPARLADPFTGAPYTYERLGPGRFRLCAAFERPTVIANRLDRRDPDNDAFTACLTRETEPGRAGLPGRLFRPAR